MKHKGFTIIELVIAIFVLFIAVIGVYSAFSKIVVLTSNISDRLVAAYLAQEGIEIVRNLRDNNWLSVQSWNQGFSICDLGCEADYKTGTASEVTSLRPYGTEGDYLKIDADNFYSYDPSALPGNETKFKREITIIQEEDDVIKVSILISWKEKKEDFTFEAEGYLYDWY